MIDIKIDANLKKSIVKNGLLFMNRKAEKMAAEIHYFDGYSKYPFKFYDSKDSLIVEKGEDYDSQRNIYFDAFFKDLMDLLDSFSSLTKSDPNYWNHFLLVLHKSGDSEMMFDFSELLEESHEASLRESLGDNLYAKYKKEREQSELKTAESKTNEPEDKSIKHNNVEMTINELISAIYQELINDVPTNFLSFEVEAELFEQEGKNVISNYYRYKTEANKEPVEFTPSNIIIPGNAVKLIQEKMKTEENDEWRKALFVFNADKTVNIKVLEK